MGDRRGNGSGGGTDERPPDAELVRRVLDGRRDAYGLLVRRYQERLYGFALGMVGDSDAASDLVQDSLIKAYTRLDSCRNPAKFESWIYQILRNRCRDFLKNIRREHEPLDDHPTLGARREGPARDFERSRLRQTLREALDTLPSSHREAFLLKHLHGHSYREISEMLDASVSAVKMRVHRSRKTLRSCIAGEPEGDGDVTSSGGRSSSEVEGASTTPQTRGDGS